MVSAENLRRLALGGGRYITSIPAHRGGEVVRGVLIRPGRYHTVADNMLVKEVTIGDGKRRRRYVVWWFAITRMRSGASASIGIR